MYKYCSMLFHFFQTSVQASFQTRKIQIVQRNEEPHLPGATPTLKNIANMDLNILYRHLLSTISSVRPLDPPHGWYCGHFLDDNLNILSYFNFFNGA